MKKIFLLAVVVLIGMTASAQQKGCFEKPVSGFTAGVYASVGQRASSDVKIGYTHKDLFFGYMSGSIGSFQEGFMTYEAPGFGIGFEYTAVQYNQIGLYFGATAGYNLLSGNLSSELSEVDYIAPKKLDAFTSAVEVGIKVEAVKNVFLKIGGVCSDMSYDRLVLNSNNMGTNQNRSFNLVVGASFVF